MLQLLTAWTPDATARRTTLPSFQTESREDGWVHDLLYVVTSIPDDYLGEAWYSPSSKQQHISFGLS